MRCGWAAFHFLEKPFHEHDLWSAIQDAIHVDQERRKAGSVQEALEEQIGILSEKEIAVLELLADCKNKRRDGRGIGGLRPHHRASPHATHAEIEDQLHTCLAAVCPDREAVKSPLPGKCLVAASGRKRLGQSRPGRFIPHNGFHTQEAHQSSTLKSPAVTGPAVKGPGRGRGSK